VRQYDFNTGADVGVLSVCKFGSPYVPPKTLSFNPAERAVVVTVSSDNGIFELSHLAKDGTSEVKDSATDGKRGSGQSAIFVARNRFAVLNKAAQASRYMILFKSLLITGAAH
jgi:coatomer subunit alpha